MLQGHSGDAPKRPARLKQETPSRASRGLEMRSAPLFPRRRPIPWSDAPANYCASDSRRRKTEMPVGASFTQS